MSVGTVTSAVKAQKVSEGGRGGEALFKEFPPRCRALRVFEVSQRTLPAWEGVSASEGSATSDDARRVGGEKDARLCGRRPPTGADRRATTLVGLGEKVHLPGCESQGTTASGEQYAEGRVRSENGAGESGLCFVTLTAIVA